MDYHQPTNPISFIPLGKDNNKNFRIFLKDVNKQVLETKYTLNLGQLLQMIPDIKHCILNRIPLKPNLPPTITSIAIYHQMAMIHVQVGKNFIEYVLVDGGSKINIITKKLNV